MDNRIQLLHLVSELGFSSSNTQLGLISSFIFLILFPLLPRPSCSPTSNRPPACLFPSVFHRRSPSTYIFEPFSSCIVSLLPVCSIISHPPSTIASYSTTPLRIPSTFMIAATTQLQSSPPLASPSTTLGNPYAPYLPPTPMTSTSMLLSFPNSHATHPRGPASSPRHLHPPFLLSSLRVTLSTLVHLPTSSPQHLFQPPPTSLTLRRSLQLHDLQPKHKKQNNIL